ncbi:MAG: dipicolinate synthase subunit DpsA [Peptococcaceae bacterium]|nr:dipicolinate synthase subunit DpsA [Peptococcaceae bacterium]
MPDLGGIRVAVLGGDARGLVLAEELAASGAEVRVAGLPRKSGSPAVVFCSEPADCLDGAGAVVLPVPGVDEKGFLYCPLVERPLAFSGELAARIPADAPVFVGTAKPLLSRMAARYGLRLIELMELDEVAILNSIPSAEGAVQMAMEMLPVTIHGSAAFVLGFGRTGMTLARLLSAMGARTRVVSRRPEHLARAVEMNLIPVPFHRMADFLGEAEVIFNTVPAPVLTGEMLAKVPPGAVIIDLASAPGGTDFRMAESFGIKAVLAPGLPGKVAPKTAGRILAQVISRILTEGM